MIRKYGESNVASIITPGPFKVKNAWKSMSTVNGVAPYIANNISGFLPDGTDKTTIKDLINPDSPYYNDGFDLRMATQDEILNETLLDAAELNGRQRETGVHACGIIISSKSLDDSIPVMIRQNDGMPVTQWTYYDCEAIGLIKMDFLGLDTVDLIDNTLKFIGKNGKPVPDMEELINGPLNDKKTFELFQRGDTEAIFQFSGDGVQEMLRMVKPTKFEDLAAITAIYRPGPMSINLHNEYADRKNDESKRLPIHEKFIGTKLEELLKDTYGALVYQEQIMKISQECAGFDSQGADKLRKAIGKKNAELLSSLEEKFKTGMINNGYDKGAVEKLWSGIVGFGSYAFNLSHSVSYALNSYQAAYLKAHYPVEFMAAVLQQRSGDSDKMPILFNECKKMGIPITSPDINESGVDITPSSDSKFITYGLSNLKKVNKEQIAKIIEERNSNGLYKDLIDFISRNKETVKSGLFRTLAQAGVLDNFGIPRKQLFENSDEIIKKASKSKELSNNSNNLLSLFGGPTVEETMFDFPNEEWDFIEFIKKEAEITGMYISSHPLDNIKQRKIDLESDTLNGSFYAAISSVKTGKARDKSTSYSVKIDTKDSQREFRLSKQFTQRFNKYSVLEKMNGDKLAAAKASGITNQEEYNKWLAIKELKPLTEHEIYKISCKTIEFGDVKRIFIEDIEPVNITKSGRIPIEIKLKNDKNLNKVLDYFENTPGTDVVRLILSNGEKVDIDNIKFVPGTTQYELDFIDK